MEVLRAAGTITSRISPEWILVIASSSGNSLFETFNRLFFCLKNRIQMSKSENVEDVKNSLVHVGEPDIAIVFANSIDGAHNCAKTSARNIGQCLAVDDDVVLA